MVRRDVADGFDAGQAEPDGEGAVAAMLAAGVGCLGIERPDRWLRIGQARSHPRHDWRLSVGQVLEFGIGSGPVQVGTADFDAVAFRVGDERLGRVEPHGLGAQERGEERGGVVEAEPGGGVDE